MAMTTATEWDCRECREKGSVILRCLPGLTPQDSFGKIIMDDHHEHSPGCQNLKFDIKIPVVGGKQFCVIQGWTE